MPLLHPRLLAGIDAGTLVEVVRGWVAYPTADSLVIEAVEKGSYEIFIGGDAKAMSRLSRLNQKNAAGLIYKNMKDLLAQSGVAADDTQDLIARVKTASDAAVPSGSST